MPRRGELPPDHVGRSLHVRRLRDVSLSRRDKMSLAKRVAHTIPWSQRDLMSLAIDVGILANSATRWTWSISTLFRPYGASECGVVASLLTTSCPGGASCRWIMLVDRFTCGDCATCLCPGGTKMSLAKRVTIALPWSRRDLMSFGPTVGILANCATSNAASIMDGDSSMLFGIHTDGSDDPRVDRIVDRDQDQHQHRCQGQAEGQTGRHRNQQLRLERSLK
jgi:hypothetical protein